jgi:hypothetical protein
MRIVVPQESYYIGAWRKPWISKVVEWQPGNMTVEWGLYSGDCHGGNMIIEAEQGDIVKMGQKSVDGSAADISTWHVVGFDGSLTDISANIAWEIFADRDSRRRHRRQEARRQRATAEATDAPPQTQPPVKQSRSGDDFDDFINSL